MKKILILLVMLPCVSLLAQSLFEQAVDNQSNTVPYELGGYLRGAFFGGKIPDLNKGEMKSGYAETALKLRVRKEEFGDAFAEIRFRRGQEFGETVSEITLREAYVNAYIGPFDVRIGEQIVVWGRADGFNPTNNITPQNMLVRSADEDDRRLGNFLIRSFYSLHPIRLELIWVPAYSASVLPVDLIPLPFGISLNGQDNVRPEFGNSSWAAKANLELSSIDASISFFDGYNPMPGILGESTDLSVQVRPEPYRVQVLGADFATTAGDLGFRGEFAYRNPDADYENLAHIPNPDLQYVLGLDKTWGDFNVILQYVGWHVIDFTELGDPVIPGFDPFYEMESKNRLLSSQQHEWNHAISFRPAINLAHEILSIEVAGLYNFTTEELLLRPKISYDLADALVLTIGGDIYTGPAETLFGTIDEALSAAFIELKASF